jgi:hypothetical protein
MRLWANRRKSRDDEKPRHGSDRRGRRSDTKVDVKELRAHSKAKTPVEKIAKLTRRTEGSLRQKALKLGIKLGHGH